MASRESFLGNTRFHCQSSATPVRRLEWKVSQYVQEALESGDLTALKKNRDTIQNHLAEQHLDRGKSLMNLFDRDQTLANIRSLETELQEVETAIRTLLSRHKNH